MRAKEKILKPDGVNFYPFPKSYNFFYLAITDDLPEKPTGSEIFEVALFSEMDILSKLNLKDINFLRNFFNNVK
jgi:hypothetical protein